MISKSDEGSQCFRLYLYGKTTEDENEGSLCAKTRPPTPTGDTDQG
jgi:hypothetical protein